MLVHSCVQRTNQTECFLQSAFNHSLSAMDDKMFDHLRASTDAKYIKSLKELFMDFYGKFRNRMYLEVSILGMKRKERLTIG